MRLLMGSFLYSCAGAIAITVLGIAIREVCEQFLHRDDGPITPV